MNKKKIFVSSIGLGSSSIVSLLNARVLIYIFELNLKKYITIEITNFFIQQFASDIPSESYASDVIDEY